MKCKIVTARLWSTQQLCVTSQCKRALSEYTITCKFKFCWIIAQWFFIKFTERFCCNYILSNNRGRIYFLIEERHSFESERERERERDLLQSQLNLYLTTLVRGEGGGVQGSFKYDIWSCQAVSLSLSLGLPPISSNILAQQLHKQLQNILLSLSPNFLPHPPLGG